MSSIDRVAPYVEQLLENRDVRADIQRAASKARQAYAGARGKKAKRKVLADKRIRRRVGEIQRAQETVAARGDTLPYLDETLVVVAQDGRSRAHRRGGELHVPAGPAVMDHSDVLQADKGPNDLARLGHDEGASNLLAHTSS